MTFSLRLTVAGWHLRVDPYGIAIVATGRLAEHLDAQVHDCDRDHPDSGCPHGAAGFTEDDVLGLLTRARDGEHPLELLAEFVAGVRAEPEGP